MSLHSHSQARTFVHSYILYEKNDFANIAKNLDIQI